MHEALFAECLPDQYVRCLLCPHHCRLAPGRPGRCLARSNKEGILIAETYGRVTSLALDPIEKKPLRHFFPGSRILSVGSYGCNLSCLFCQNWSIASRQAAWTDMTPQELVGRALALRPQGNIGLAFTYNEPLINFEFVLDSFRLAHTADLKTVLVTNGMIESRPLAALLPFVDAMNIDLKAFHNAFYQKICGGYLDPVRQTIQACHGRCEMEITTLLIPGLNDLEQDIDDLAQWLAGLSPDIPWHLTRHQPAYRMPEPQPIPVERLLALAARAGRYLHRVYPGNI